MPLPARQQATTGDGVPTTDSTQRFADILQQRGAGDASARVAALAVAGGRATALARAAGGSAQSGDLTAAATGSGTASAVSFIDGSLFGHSVVLPGSAAAPAAGGAVTGMSGASSANNAASIGTGKWQSSVAQAASDPQMAQASLGATSILPEATAPFASVDAFHGTDLSILGEGKGFPADAPPAVGQDRAVGTRLDPTIRAWTQSMPMGVAGGAAADGSEVEVPTSAGETTASARSVTAQESREAQVACLSPVHVAVAFGADGAVLRILARVSGVAATDEDHVERSLLAAARQGTGAVEQLRLNGIERITSVRN